MGDMTNFVVVFAGELLQNAEYLLKMGLHISEVMDGYRLAGIKALELYEQVAIDTVADAKSKEELFKVVKSSIAAKQVFFLIFSIHFSFYSMDMKTCYLD